MVRLEISVEVSEDHAPAQTGDLRYVRGWLLMEIYYFFNWIFASAIFIACAYLIKFKPLSKHEDVASNDEDIWNDKDTDDFLHYLKAEYFLLTYYIANIITELMFCFGRFDMLESFGWEDYDNRILRSWFPTKFIFILMMLTNLNFMYSYIHQLHGD